jgi:hypothetical protein
MKDKECRQKKSNNLRQLKRKRKNSRAMTAITMKECRQLILIKRMTKILKKTKIKRI